jgi:hypothetical protein
LNAERGIFDLGQICFDLQMDVEPRILVRLYPLPAALSGCTSK